VKRRGRKLARMPYQIKIKIGAPIRFDAASEPQQIANALQKSVQEL
jgi:hypothetical protein